MLARTSDDRRFRAAGFFVALFLMAAAPALAQLPTFEVVDQSVDFSSDTSVTVAIVLHDAASIAGVNFWLEYPSDLLAVDFETAPTTHANGALFGSVTVNHDNLQAPVPAAGIRRIAVAAAQATPLGVDAGTLIEVTFPVTCAGFAQDFPTGREVALHLAMVEAYDEIGDPIVVSVQDGVLTLNCTALPVETHSFSTIKSTFSSQEVR